MPPWFSARFRDIIGRKPLRGAVFAVIAVLAVTTGILASTPIELADAHARTVSAPRMEPVPGPELAAERLLAEADLAGEFSFVLYDSVLDAYVLSHGADEVHLSQSTAKLLIGIGALERGVDPAVVAEMISWSDDPIANALWGVVEGPVVIEEQAEAMGLQHTAPSPDWPRWGDMRTTAADMVRIHQYVLNELPEDDRAVVIDAMIATTEKGSDGFDQTFGIPSAAGDLEWAVKQGWGCCKPDRFLVSTGTLGADHRYIAAIFGAFDETRVGETQSAAEMTAVAEALIAALPEPA